MKESNAAYWRQKNQNPNAWPLAKSLTLIPESYRFALAYGINPHTGATSPAGQWRIRNVIRWVRHNPSVGALGDKFRCGTTELVVACTSKDRFFDLDAVREPAADPLSRGNPNGLGRLNDPGRYNSNPAGAPPLDWWKISPKGYSGAHYAVWPSELCVKPIKAMCPEKVCRTCGEPSRRITEYDYEPTQATNNTSPRGLTPGVKSPGADPSYSAGRANVVVKELGWSDCGHDNFRPGMVLDPFAGTGTTLAVAHGHGRDAIGIDLDPRNVSLALDRIGPLFLEVVEHEQTWTQSETDRSSFLAEGSQGSA